MRRPPNGKQFQPYGFDGSGLRSSEPIPDWLAPLRDKAARFAGGSPEAFEHALLIEYAPKGYMPADAVQSRELLQQYHTSLHRLARESQPHTAVAALASFGGITDILVL